MQLVSAVVAATLVVIFLFFVGALFSHLPFLALLITSVIIAISIRSARRQRRAAASVLSSITAIGQGHAKAIADRVKMDTGITIGAALWVELLQLEEAGLIEVDWQETGVFPRHRIYRVALERRRSAEIVRNAFGRLKQ